MRVLKKSLDKLHPGGLFEPAPSIHLHVCIERTEAFFWRQYLSFSRKLSFDFLA